MTVGELCEAMNGFDSDMEVFVGVESVQGSGEWDRFEPLRFSRTFIRLRAEDEPSEKKVVLFT